MQIPKNVMQIGEPDALCKIYIEDYVSTYIRQLKREFVTTCKIHLYGKQMQKDGKQYYFVTAAIQDGKDAGKLKETYFPAEKLLGNLTLRQDAEILQFAGGAARAFDGYYIYYEENEAMQSFLVSQHKEEQAPRETKANIEGRYGLDIRRAERRETTMADRPVAGRNATESRWTLQNEREERRTAADEPAPGRAVSDRPGSGRLAADGAATGRTAADRPQSGGAASGWGAVSWTERQEEPRRIGRAMEERQETRLPRRPQNGRAKPLYLGCTCLLLLLCVMGITAMNRYGKLQDLGEIFGHLRQTMEQSSEEEQAQETMLQISEIENGFAQENEDAALAGKDGAADEADPGGAGDIFAESDGIESAGGTEGTESPLPETDGAAGEAGAGGDIFAESDGTESAGDAEGAGGSEGNAGAGSTPAEPEAEETMAAAAKEEDILSASEMAPSDTGESAQITGIPNLALEETAAAEYETYIVKEGDTLAKISRMIYGDDSRVMDICRLNEIANPDHVIPGQKLLLPK